ncbi:MAG TPA: hypothetical protein VF139_02220 [Candidatus Polarisedimenticolaceae bacterium]
MPHRFRAWLLLSALATASCAPRVAPSICTACFWEHQPPGFREELVRFYRGYATDDPLIAAERDRLVARVAGEDAALCEARARFESLADSESEPSRRLLAAETAAFDAAACGVDPEPAFLRAADAADPRKAAIYRTVAGGSFRPRFGSASIATRLDPPRGTTSYVLGASAIRVDTGDVVVVQAERTVRDWLSYQLRWNPADAPAPAGALIGWHEGARLSDLLGAVEAKVEPAVGVLAAFRDGRWLAPDADGVFRFEVLEDKVQYPTTRVHGGLALLVDTHGVSALVEAAARREASLVVACGDHPEKMKAALALARSGRDVWFPCDRFVGDVLGYEAPGTLLGSAPVRREGDHAVIGDRPVRFEVAETVVVEDAAPRGDLRYYDAPARYFRALAAKLPIPLQFVEVDGPGQAAKVVDRALALGADVIAIRVETAEDAAPVRAWLSGSPRRRAVLFHTAPYAPGYALFGEFPKQTTSGDPRPEFD